MTFKNSINRRTVLSGLTALPLLPSVPAFADPNLLAHQTIRKALVIVSLADNRHQGIVPIKASLGNGQDPANNLYWGALYGVKSYFKRHKDFAVLAQPGEFQTGVLDQITITPTSHKGVKVEAVAIDGFHQKIAVSQFFNNITQTNTYDLVVFMGHNALMDFEFKGPSKNIAQDVTLPRRQKAAVIACQSKRFFNPLLSLTNADPYVMTNGNMAPEAYVLEGILNAWLKDESAKQAQDRAAERYAHFQKIPLKNAKWLFTG